MEQITSQIAKAVNTAISSSWAIFVAATVALFLFFFGDLVGLDRQRVDLHFLVDAATFLMVFVIGGARPELGDPRAAHEQIIDAPHQRIGVERLRHHIADAEAREGLFGTVGKSGEE